MFNHDYSDNRKLDIVLVVTISKNRANNFIFIELKFSNKSMRSVMKKYLAGIRLEIITHAWCIQKNWKKNFTISRTKVSPQST